jgi:lipopolysaccharide transport system permease protein
MAESVVAKPELAPDQRDGTPGEAGADAARPGHAPSHSARGFRVIEAPSPGIRRVLSTFWRSRAALGYFFISYMRKRYGRTFLGYFWLVIPVIVPLLLSSLVFGGILGVKVQGGIPYFLYFLVASNAWTLFAGTAYFATRSLEITRSDLRKLYVPRMVPWVASITLPLLQFAVYMVILAGTLVYYVITRNEFYLVLEPATLLAPVGMAMLLFLGLLCGLWFAPLAPRARDVRRSAGYFLGMWYFLTPVIYPIEQIPSDWRWLAELNPVTAPVEIFKIALINVGDVTTTGLISYAVAVVVIGAGGLRHFVVKERRDIAWYY